MTIRRSSIEENYAGGTGGGGIFNNGGVLNIFFSNIRANLSSDHGGGLYLDRGPVSSGGVVNIEDSVIDDNRGERGAGIYNEATLMVRESEMSRNDGNGTSGGAIYTVTGGMTTLDDVDFDDNDPDDTGGVAPIII